MKIIDKNDCYVSKEDLLYLFDQDECMPLSLQQGLRDALVNDKDYIRVIEDKGLEYIYTSNIPSFENLAKLKISELRKQIVNIILEDTLNDNQGDSLSLSEIIKERKNREYIIKQLKEMIAFKKRKSQVIYPDVPYPYIPSIKNDEYISSISYNLDRVVIYNLDGSRVEKVDDVEFCNESFKLLSQDTSEDIDLDMTFDGNYFVMKNKNKKKKLLRKIVD